LKNVTDSTKASIMLLDKNKQTIRTFTTDAKEARDKFEISKGMNQFVWDMNYTEGDRIDGMILWNGIPGSIKAAPGQYYVRIKTGKDSAEAPFTVKADPNYKITQAEYEDQFNFLLTARDKFNEVQKAIKDIRALRTQINDVTSRAGKDLPKEVKQLADTINKQMTAIEEALYQTKSRSGQDVLNYPIRINDKLSGVFDAANSGVQAPSKQVRDVYTELAGQADAELAKLKRIREEDIPKLNQLIREKMVPVIGLKKE
jgi:hypothetical protein